MEARIIDAMAGRVDARTINTVLRIEREWFEHLRTGGMDTWATRDGIKRRHDIYWFEAWTKASGAAPLLNHWSDMAYAVRSLAECASGTASQWLRADIEQRIATAAVAAAHVSTELFTLSLARLDGHTGDNER